ncbi:glycosyltransferase family 4 protein [Proteus mirabilis]|uniref:glycosyltransferase family 4 protein n=1 Tax=Proteus mirabilis TaxID=584 RepID=UPI002023F097|nr:glycosyltransferase family 4 protein [Proteus mirabilis]MCL8559526.1 glycosyltransferase family 4 protein [Proteus mirabilis]MDF7212584.1 glycosyltransferase family 4 protein [Proteus mirabilis]MDF7396600.1 glycosyltransferase family 4 protein [Proteus mirabilis]
MKKYRAIQIGNFGGNKEQIDGQTIKTNLFFNLVEKHYSNVLKIDIYKYNTIQFLLLFIKLPFFILRAEVIFIGLGKKGMTTLAPWCIILSNILKKEINYYVIGGWVYTLLNEKKWLIKYFKNFNKILVELPSMINSGSKFGLYNIEYFPNFRKIDNTLFIKKTKKNNLSIFFFSRVIKEKGILILLEAIDKINKEKLNINLTIFGPIYEESIKKEIKKRKNVIYLGILDPFSNILYETLNQYDLMIFPTFYNGEGFPGAIVDSFLSATPVIASNWKYNSEIIKDHYNGRIINNDCNTLCETLKYYYYNPNELDILKKNAQASSINYSYNKASEIFKNIFIRN